MYSEKEIKFRVMELSTLFKVTRSRKSNFKLMKNNRINNKIVINTIMPKFEYKNNKGELVKPITKSSF